MIYSLGTDIGKDEFEACLQTYRLAEQRHQVIARKSFKNKPSGFKACLQWAARHKKQPKAPFRVTMEATGVYYEALALHIQEHHPQTHLAVVLPSKSKKYIQSRGLRSKTDKIDAYGLALMGAERKLAGWKGIDPFWRELRALTRTRANLLEQCTALRNQLHALRHSGIEVPQAMESLQQCIQALSSQINTLKQRIYRHLRKRKELNEAIECLKSIHGIGKLTIAVVLAETNGFRTFHSISQLVSFSGYDVKIRQSGKWTGKPKISKQGSKYIRRAMYMPANTIIRSKDGPIWELYQRLLGKHNVEMKAHVAVQKKLLQYMYVLWNKQEPFDPQKIRDLQAYHDNVAPSENEATVDTSSAVA
jgi:transposase